MDFFYTVAFGIFTKILYELYICLAKSDTELSGPSWSYWKFRFPTIREKTHS